MASAASPLATRDARRFWLWMVPLLVLPAWAMWTLFQFDTADKSFDAFDVHFILRDRPEMGIETRSAYIIEEEIWWLAMRGLGGYAGPLILLLHTLCVAGAHVYELSPKRAGTAAGRGAVALGYYFAGAMLVSVLGWIGLIAGAWLVGLKSVPDTLKPATQALAYAGFALVPVGWLLTAVSTARLRRRMLGGGWWRICTSLLRQVLVRVCYSFINIVVLAAAVGYLMLLLGLIE